MYYDNNVIEHHGVLGMKWGVRHDKTSSGSKKQSSKTKIKKKIASAEEVRSRQQTIKALELGAHQNPNGSRMDIVTDARLELTNAKTRTQKESRKALAGNAAIYAGAAGLSAIATGNFIVPVSLITSGAISTATDARTYASIIRSYDMSISRVDEMLAQEAAKNKR